jgi:hypothetical protein
LFPQQLKGDVELWQRTSGSVGDLYIWRLSMVNPSSAMIAFGVEPSSLSHIQRARCRSSAYVFDLSDNVPFSLSQLLRASL